MVWERKKDKIGPVERLTLNDPSPPIKPKSHNGVIFILWCSGKIKLVLSLFIEFLKFINLLK